MSLPTPDSVLSPLPQAYIHTRMRAKTSDFLKVLNRARPDAEKKEMKTISWVVADTAVEPVFASADPPTSCTPPHVLAPTIKNEWNDGVYAAFVFAAHPPAPVSLN